MASRTDTLSYSVLTSSSQNWHLKQKIWWKRCGKIMEKWEEPMWKLSVHVSFNLYSYHLESRWPWILLLWVSWKPESLKSSVFQFTQRKPKIWDWIHFIPHFLFIWRLLWTNSTRKFLMPSPDLLCHTWHSHPWFLSSVEIKNSWLQFAAPRC